ncbi:MAG: family glycosyltransferase [Proteobacteria bacterium]|nr:family glycosyltransferase [Pseudomonadota bacterium]
MPRLPPILSFDAATFMEHASMMSREHILTRLAKETVVLHSTPPLGRNITAPKRGMVEASQNLYHYTNPGYLPRLYRSAVGERFFSRLRSLHRRYLLSTLGQTDIKPILYIWHPEFVDEIGRYGECMVVYHIYDDYPNLPGASDNLVAKELEILNVADIVFGANQSLIDARKKIVARDYIHLPQGVDFQLFQEASQLGELPKIDIEEISGPRVGYIGRVNKKVDLALVHAIAKRRPEWNFTFVGPVDSDPELALDLDRIRQLKNVYFLGPKPFKDVPRYWMALDVAIIPYRHEPGQWAFFGSPLKLQESFAAGKGVVISPLNETKAYENLIRVAEGENAWIDAIDALIKEKGDASKEKARIEFASGNSWESRVERIKREILDRL